MSIPDQAIKVRRGDFSDLEAIIRFNAAMALETEGKGLELERLREGVSAVLRQENLGFYLVAEIKGEIAGQLLITTEWSDWRNAFFWWIQSVYVAPGHRQQGVYRALHETITLLASEQGGVCGVRLYVERGNQAAQNVYRRMGMSQSHYDMYETEF